MDTLKRFAAPAMVLFVLGIALMIPRLGAHGLWDPWEPKYVQAASEMRARADLIVPHYRGDPRLNKPPLTYWLIGLSQSVLGRTETAARLPSALLAILAPIVLAFALAARGRRLEGFLAGAALLSAPAWPLLGRFATPDMPLASLLALALAAAIAAPVAPTPRSRRWLVTAAVVAIALAGLVDWPRGLLLPLWAVLVWGAITFGWRGLAALVVVATLYTTGQYTYSVAVNVASYVLAAAGGLAVLRLGQVVSTRGLLRAVAIVVVLVTPWFVAAYRAEPEEMDILKYKHAFNLGESTGSFRGDLDYVVRIVAVGALPWIAAALVGLTRAFGRRRDEVAAIAAAAALGGLLFFTLAEPRMSHFYGVIQPALAVLAGIGTVALVRRTDWTTALAAATLAGVGLYVWSKPQRLLETATVKYSLYELDPRWALVVGLAGWAAAVAVARVARRESWSVAAVIPAAVLAGVLALWLVPALGDRKSLRPIWERYLAERRAGEPIAAMGQAKESGFYYSDLALVRVKSRRDLAEFLAGDGDRYAIMPRRDWREFDGGSSGGQWLLLRGEHPTHILARWTPD